MLSSETPWVKIIGFAIFKNPVLSNYPIPVRGICFLDGISKTQSRLVWTAHVITLPSWWMILLNLLGGWDPWPWHMVWSSGDEGIAWGPVSLNSLQIGNTATLIRGLLTMYTNRTLPGAVTGHQGRLPSTIFYCANADKWHSNGSWGAISPPILMCLSSLLPSQSVTALWGTCPVDMVHMKLHLC